MQSFLVDEECPLARKRGMSANGQKQKLILILQSLIAWLTNLVNDWAIRGRLIRGHFGVPKLDLGNKCKPCFMRFLIVFAKRELIQNLVKVLNSRSL